MRGIVRMSQSLICGVWGGGGRDHVKFIVTQPKSVSSDPSFRPWHLKHSHPIGKKYHCVGRYNTFTCYLQFARKPRPCSSQCAKTNWKPQETKQHHSTEWDRNGNQLDVLSSCNLKERDKCCPSPFLDATNSFDCEFRVLLITLCLTQRKNTSAF